MAGRGRAALHRPRAPQPDLETAAAAASRSQTRYWAILDEANSAADAKAGLLALADDYRSAYPSAMAVIDDNVDQLVAHLRFPAEHRKRTRSTNLLERTFVELAMLDAGADVLAERAARLAEATGGTVVEATARVGGGALPLLELAGPVVAIDPETQGVDGLAAKLRAGDPPLVARIRDGRLLVDPRTLAAADPELRRNVYDALRLKI